MVHTWTPYIYIHILKIENIENVIDMWTPYVYIHILKVPQ